MFRLTQFMRELVDGGPVRAAAAPRGPVVIWNLIRRCNLTCRHCYSISADRDFAGELDTAEVLRVLDDLKEFGVPAVILSGGEPLLRPDVYDIARRAKDLGMYVGLSSNGTLVDAGSVPALLAVGFDYVGISLDGLRATHDAFRRKAGAFDASLAAVRLCRDAGIRVGLRFTLTQDNAHELPDMLALMDSESISRFYLSHLNYAGRGNINRKRDATLAMSRRAVDLLIERCWNELSRGAAREYVTGNNDADGVRLLMWVRDRHPALESRARTLLARWGGNASGLHVANIDNLGNVHPDTFWWNHTLGNVRERRFGDIWLDTSDPLMAGLKLRPRPVQGRCGRCDFLDICGGNTRVRAFQLTGDPWAEDPACYLTDEEIGVASPEVPVEAAAHGPGAAVGSVR